MLDHSVPPDRHYLAFDLEIARVIPDGIDDWSLYRPFGITCAATLEMDRTPRVWHGHTLDGAIAGQMSRAETAEIVTFLEGEVAAGKTIVTWNGAGFDFSVLAEESGLTAVCARLADAHIDMMYHFFCLKGFALGLDKAAQGMGVQGKMSEVGGANAPRFWQQGRYEEVLDYVCQDVTTTLQVCQAVEHQGSLQWITGRGTTQLAPFSSGWLTVAEASQLPLPDTSWMRTPWSRKKFTGWITG